MASRAVTSIPGLPFPVGKSPKSIAVEDFNSDGHADLVLALATFPNAQARWFFGDGTGRFVDSGRRSIGGGTSMSLGITDLDLDGELDLIVANGSWPPSATISFGLASEAYRLELTTAGGCWGRHRR